MSKLTDISKMQRKLLTEKRCFGLARIIAMIVPIIYLILSPIQISALLKLENETCGFISFISFLFGLVVLFEASRAEEDQTRSKIRLYIFIIFDCIVLLKLIGIFHNALINQISLKNSGIVLQAISLSWGVICCYLLVLVLLTISVIKGCSKNEN